MLTGFLHRDGKNGTTYDNFTPQPFLNLKLLTRYLQLFWYKIKWKSLILSYVHFKAARLLATSESIVSQKVVHFNILKYGIILEWFSNMHHGNYIGRLYRYLNRYSRRYKNGTFKGLSVYIMPMGYKGMQSWSISIHIILPTQPVTISRLFIVFANQFHTSLVPTSCLKYLFSKKLQLREFLPCFNSHDQEFQAPPRHWVLMSRPIMSL